MLLNIIYVYIFQLIKPYYNLLFVEYSHISYAINTYIIIIIFIHYRETINGIIKINYKLFKFQICNTYLSF